MFAAFGESIHIFSFGVLLLLLLRPSAHAQCQASLHASYIKHKPVVLQVCSERVALNTFNLQLALATPANFSAMQVYVELNHSNSVLVIQGDCRCAHTYHRKNDSKFFDSARLAAAHNVDIAVRRGAAQTLVDVSGVSVAAGSVSRQLTVNVAATRNGTLEQRETFVLALAPLEQQRATVPLAMYFVPVVLVAALLLMLAASFARDRQRKAELQRMSVELKRKERQVYATQEVLDDDQISEISVDDEPLHPWGVVDESTLYDTVPPVTDEQEPMSLATRPWGVVDESQLYDSVPPLSMFQQDASLTDSSSSSSSSTL